MSLTFYDIDSQNHISWSPFILRTYLSLIYLNVPYTRRPISMAEYRYFQKDQDGTKIILEAIKPFTTLFEEGSYLTGGKPIYADFCIAAILYWFRFARKEETERAITLAGKGEFKCLLEAVEKDVPLPNTADK